MFSRLLQFHKTKILTCKIIKIVSLGKDMNKFLSFYKMQTKNIRLPKKIFCQTMHALAGKLISEFSYGCAGYCFAGCWMVLDSGLPCN
jgi:hypothetical protein